jgi:hypothetical protein
MHRSMHFPAMFWPESDKPSCAGRSPKHDSFPVPIGVVRHMSGSTGARNGEGQCSLGDILGLTHPGYELSPLRGCRDTVERDLGKGKNAVGQAFHPDDLISRAGKPDQHQSP